MFEIECDALLIPIDTQEVRAFTVLKRGSPCSGVIAFSRLFDFDDPGSHVGEHHRTVRAGEHTGEIDHGDPIKRPVDWFISHRGQDFMLSLSFEYTEPGED